MLDMCCRFFMVLCCLSCVYVPSLYMLYALVLCCFGNAFVGWFCVCGCYIYIYIYIYIYHVLAIYYKFQGELNQHNQHDFFDIIEKGENEASSYSFDDIPSQNEFLSFIMLISL